MNNSKNAIIFNTLILCLVFILGGCSSDESGSKSSARKPAKPISGSFEVRFSNGITFNHKSKKAKIHYAEDDIWGFETFGNYFRVSGRLADSGPDQSNDLNYNNTIMSFYTDIEGKRTKVGCRPAQDPVGKIERTELTDTTVSGNFTVEFIKCRDFYSSEDIESLRGVKIIAEGEFKDIQLIDPFASYKK